MQSNYNVYIYYFVLGKMAWVEYTMAHIHLYIMWAENYDGLWIDTMLIIKYYKCYPIIDIL